MDAEPKNTPQTSRAEQGSNETAAASQAADFQRVLARIQSDYNFYVELQKHPDQALQGYDLSPAERQVLTNAPELASVLSGMGSKEFGITITITGTHDWFNPTNVQPPHISPPTISISPPPPPGPPPGPPPPPPGPPPPPPGPPPPPPGPPPPGPPPPPGGHHVLPFEVPESVEDQEDADRPEVQRPEVQQTVQEVAAAKDEPARTDALVKLMKAIG